VGVVAAAERAVAVAEDHLGSTRIAQAAGTATGVDVLSAQTDVSRRKSELLQAVTALAKAEEGLGALLGIDGRARVALPSTPAPEPGTEGRPALDAAELQVSAARARVQAAWWRHVPVVTASATGLAATVPFATGNETAYRFGLDATWTLYDGGLRYGRLTQAKAELASAEAYRSAEELRVSREIRDAERDWDVAREQFSLSEEQARLGAEAASVAQRGLMAGTVSPLQARDIEAEAFRAEVGVATARARLRIAEATLRRARGLDQRW
jgi:outer membrane protein TolC